LAKWFIKNNLKHTDIDGDLIRKCKELKLQKPDIQIKTIDKVTIEISSDILAKDVYLSSEEDTFFEDNYFDLLPNEKRIIKLSKAVTVLASASKVAQAFANPCCKLVVRPVEPLAVTPASPCKEVEPLVSNLAKSDALLMLSLRVLFHKLNQCLLLQD